MLDKSKIWPDDGTRRKVKIFSTELWDCLTLDIDPWRGWILCYFHRIDFLSQRNLRSWKTSQLNFIVLILQCPILEVLQNVFNIALNLITDRCCPLAGWPWWSCTATRTTTTRSFCENLRGSIDPGNVPRGSVKSQRLFPSWDLQNLLEDWQTHTFSIWKASAQQTQIVYFLPCLMATHNFLKTPFVNKWFTGLWCLNRTTEVEI